MLRAGPYTFRQVTYDASSDVLYATIAQAPTARRERSPEGHVWSFDERGRFTGVALMSPREQLEREGSVSLTLPTGERERVQGVEAALRAET
jgi:uncharacterized protein YuzE